MKNLKWKILVIITVLLAVRTYAHAQGISGWINLIRNDSRNFEDGEKISESDTVNKNFYLKLDKPITPMLFYQINLRANMQDSDVTDADGTETSTSLRRIEPALDFRLNNPMYDASAGYRRQEKWDAAKLRNENRETSEFYYTRFNISPDVLPSFSLSYDRQNDFDYPPEKDTDSEKDTYTISSSYSLPSRDLVLMYNFDISHSVDRDPLGRIEKTVNDNYNGNYNVRYSGFFWNKKASYSLGYQGNYARNKNRQFVMETGIFVNERQPLGGLYAQGSTGNEDVDVLQTERALVEDETVSTDIEIGNEDIINNRFHNLGIFVSSQRPVDRLFIYVNRDVTENGDDLRNPDNWEVYKSASNQADTWGEPLKLKNMVIDVTPVDVFNDIYRYELELSEPHSASFYKAVNLATSSVSDVQVTKIEAWGTDDVSENVSTTISTSFTQGANFVTSVRALTELDFTFNYSLNRTDQNPVSFPGSVMGFFKNTVSDSVSGDEEDFRSSITRNYSVTTKWLTHRLLTTTARLQRSENFDNLDETDSHSNTYNLSFSYVPLTTLDTTISFIRSDRFSFGDRETTNNSVLLSIGSQLYRDVNVVNDLSYTETKSHVNDTHSKSYTLNGTVDTVVTRELSGILNYGYNRSSSNGDSTVSKEVLTKLTYQPGRLVNLSGNFSVLDSSGETTTSEGILVDWLPLPALRLNLSYQHTDSDSGPSVRDNFSGYGIWYITKFADVRFSYGYTKISEDVKTEDHNFNTNLNCRF